MACIFTVSDSVVPSYLSLVDAFTKGADFVPPFPDINTIQKDHLELYLKKMGPFSDFMHDFPIGEEEKKGVKNEFKVRGPFVYDVFNDYRDQD